MWSARGGGGVTYFLTLAILEKRLEGVGGEELYSSAGILDPPGRRVRWVCVERCPVARSAVEDGMSCNEFRWFSLSCLAQS